MTTSINSSEQLRMKDLLKVPVVPISEEEVHSSCNFCATRQVHHQFHVPQHDTNTYLFNNNPIKGV